LAAARLAASGLAATILLVAEQTTAMLAAAGRSTAARLAAATLLEQTSVGLIFAQHGVTNHGSQHGNRRNDDTIHLKSSHV
jgi:hypothetical protein